MKPGTLGELSAKLASIATAVSASYLPWDDLQLPLTADELRSTDAALDHLRAVVHCRARAPVGPRRRGGVMAASEWTPGSRGSETRRTAHGTIYLEGRPYYCDRGRFKVQVQPAYHPACRSCAVDEADGFPRYYFDLERAKAEMQAWVEARGWDRPADAGPPPPGSRPPDGRPPARGPNVIGLGPEDATGYRVGVETVIEHLEQAGHTGLAASLQSLLLPHTPPAATAEEIRDALARAPLDDEPYTEEQRASGVPSDVPGDPPVARAQHRDCEPRS